MLGRRGPSLLNRALAGAKREVPTVNLEAFVRAGAGVFELDLLVDARRAELHAGGIHPWDADGAMCSLFLASWVARVHQTLGTGVLTADHSLDPRTRGYVPVAIHQQARAFFQPVAFWLMHGGTASRRHLASGSVPALLNTGDLHRGGTARADTASHAHASSPRRSRPAPGRLRFTR